MDSYMPRGYVRQRALDKHVFHDTQQPERQPLPMMRGKIIETRQHENTHDVALSDGTILRHVPVASTFAGTNYGTYRTAKIQNTFPQRTAEGSLDTGALNGMRDAPVLVSFLGGSRAPSFQRAVIVGHVQPQVNQLTNAAIGSIDRTPSDSVQLWTYDEHMAEYAPDFTGVVRGPDPNRWYPQAHDPGMEGPPDFDKKWKVINEDDKQHFYAVHCQGSDATFFMHPNGSTTMMRNDGNGNLLAAVTITKNGDLVSTTQGNHTVSAGVVTLNSPIVHVNGDLHVTGQILASDVTAPSGTVPGPPSAPGGSTPPPGPIASHDLPLITPPNNPLTGKRDQPIPPNNP